MVSPKLIQHYLLLHAMHIELEIDSSDWSDWLRSQPTTKLLAYGSQPVVPWKVDDRWPGC